MLAIALILSIAGTAYCIWAEAHPPIQSKPPDPATQVIVQMIEESGDDFDEDPPTVVQTRST